MPSRKTILILHLAGQIPLAGVLWQALHYLVGLRDLGHDVYYAEESGAPPYDPRVRSNVADPTYNVACLQQTLTRFGFADHWGYWDQGEDRHYGLSRDQLRGLHERADVTVNLCGAMPPPAATKRRGLWIYIETDPVFEQIRAAQGEPLTLEFLSRHNACFTYAENLGASDCPIPFQGQTYYWSKHVNFLKFLDLPRRTPQSLELAVETADEQVRAELATRGWRLADAAEPSATVEGYRDYIYASRGEFTVAKDMYVRPRSGWFSDRSVCYLFSDRSVCYLAAGKPVVTQETAFSKFIPTGNGLFAFSTLDEAVSALAAINGDYLHHAHAAREIAADYFAADKVLRKLLLDVGVE